jgi:hypothetical protein
MRTSRPLLGGGSAEAGGARKDRANTVPVSGRPATAPAGASGAAGKASSWRSQVHRPAPLLIPDDKRARQRHGAAVSGGSSAKRSSISTASSARPPPGRLGGAPTRGADAPERRWGAGGAAGSEATEGGDAAVERIDPSPDAGAASPTQVSKRKRVPFDPSTPDSLGSTVLDTNSPAMLTGSTPPSLPHDAHSSPSPWRAQTIREEHCLASPQHPAREAQPYDDCAGDTEVGGQERLGVGGGDKAHTQAEFGDYVAASPGVLTEVSALSRSVLTSVYSRACVYG